MDKAVYDYKKRRQARLDAKNGVQEKRDSVEEFKKRRGARLNSRMDAGVGWVFGALKENGVDTTGMSVKEAFEALGKLNGGSSKGGGKKESGKKRTENSSEGKNEIPKSVKGVTISKSESGFEIPLFDEKTFTDNFEEKKQIARDAAKRLVPAVKKELSTEVKEITRPKVDESTKEFLKNAVSGATPEQIDTALEEADKMYRYWEKNEPKITESVVGAVKGVGGSMYGLDNRRKFDKSLAKKMLGDAQDPQYDGDVVAAAANIKDGARYTAVFDSDNLVDGYNKVKAELEKMGIKEYRCKNFWAQYRDQDGSGDKIGEQKSIQSVFQTPDGKMFELQFHIPESLAAKEVNHPTYKQKKEPLSEHVEYNKPRSLLMRDTSSVVPDPKGVFDIEEHKRGETGYK